MKNSVLLGNYKSNVPSNINLSEANTIVVQEADCYVPFGDAEILAHKEIVSDFRKPSQGALSVHYLSAIEHRIPTVISGKTNLQYYKDYRALQPVANLVSSTSPIVAKADIGPVNPSAIGNATAGSGIIGTFDLDGIIDGATVDSYTTKRRVVGYLVHVTYTSNDIGKVLQITDGTNTIAKMSANDDDCMGIYLYFPVASSAYVNETDEGLLFGWGDSGITISFVITGATSLGGWEIQTQPIYATSELAANVVPIQTKAGNFAVLNPGC
jgi:hypothetical protein